MIPPVLKGLQFATLIAATPCLTSAELVRFDDPTLEMLVAQSLGLPGGPVDSSALDNLTSLAISGTEVTNLSGIGAATHLSRVSFHRAAPIDLSPLASLPRLHSLYIYDCPQLPLGTLPRNSSLHSLTINHSSLAIAPDLSLFPNLRFLDLSDNSITGIPSAQGHQTLATVRVARNRLDSITPFASLPDLYQLDFSSNHVRSIDSLAGRPPLRIDATANFLDLSPGSHTLEILLSTSTPLTSRWIDDQLFQRLPFSSTVPDPRLARALRSITGQPHHTPLRPADLAAIVSLDLAGFGISDPTGLENLTATTSLDLRDNLITEISALAGLTGLRLLQLDNNYLDLDDPDTTSALATLSAAGTSVELGTQRLPQPLDNAARPLRESVNRALERPLETPLTDLDLARLDAIGIYALDQPVGSLDPLQHATFLRKLLIRYSSSVSPLSEINPENPSHCPAVLDLSPLTGHQYLEHLKLENPAPRSISVVATLPRLRVFASALPSSVSTDPIAAATNLQALTLGRCSHHGIDLASLTPLSDLVSLTLAFPGAGELRDVSPLVKLRHLQIHGTLPSGLDQFAGFTALRKLSLSYNRLTSLQSIHFPPALEELDLEGNRLTTLHDAALPATLRTLVLERNLLTDLSDLPPLPALTHLSARFNQLASFPVIDAPALQSVNFNGNSIADISTLEHYRTSPLAGIILDDNAVSDLTPVTHLQNLRSLSIDRNKIPDFSPIMQLTKLSYISGRWNFQPPVADHTPFGRYMNENFGPGWRTTRITTLSTAPYLPDQPRFDRATRELVWQPQPGYHYRVERSDDLSIWRRLEPPPDGPREFRVPVPPNTFQRVHARSVSVPFE